VGRTLPASFSKCGRHIVRCRDLESAFFIEVENSEFGLADPCRVRQDRLKHRRELAGRTGYDAQDLRSGRLLLQRLVTLTGKPRDL
jgi:hypothetical protein